MEVLDADLRFSRCADSTSGRTIWSMKIITAGVTSAMLAAGLVGSVAAYRTQADPADVMRPAAEATAAETAEEAPEAAKRPRPRCAGSPVPRAAPCERGTCVTDVVRTVVLAGPVTHGGPAHTGGAAGRHDPAPGRRLRPRR